MLFCYTRIAIVIGAGMSGPSETTTERDEKMEKVKVNTIKTLVMVNVCFVLCWSTNVVIAMSFNLGQPLVPYTSDIYHFSVAMVFANSCLNPFIYALKYQQFQQQAKKLIQQACGFFQHNNLEQTH